MARLTDGDKGWASVMSTVGRPISAGLDRRRPNSAMRSAAAANMKARVSQLSLAVPSYISDENFMSGRTASYMNCVGIGHPFLVYHIRVPSAFLKRHSIKLDTSSMRPHSDKYILTEALQMQCNKGVAPVPGGYALDVAQAMQWVLGQPKSVVFLGSRAMDEDALTFMETSRDIDVYFRLEEKIPARTTVMGVFHHNKKYSEVVFVDPAQVAFSMSFVDRPSNTKLLERANVMYTSDFCLSMMRRVVHKLAYYTHSRFKLFCVHLRNIFFIQRDKEALQDILAYTDILFLTPECAATVVQLYQIPECKTLATNTSDFLLQEPKTCCRNAKERARTLSHWVRSLSHKTCTVILSDGLKRAHVYTEIDTSTSIHYRSVFAKDCTVDDLFGVQAAFVGGFMAMMIQGHQIEPCIHCGFYCSSIVARQRGMVFPFSFSRKEMLMPLCRLLEVLSESGGKENQFIKRVGVKKSYHSDMPFTIFHTPWTKQDTEVMQEDLYGASKNMPQSPV